MQASGVKRRKAALVARRGKFYSAGAVRKTTVSLLVSAAKKPAKMGHRGK